MKIAITGATGNMGQAVVAALRDVDFIDNIKVLSHNGKRTKRLLKANKSLIDKITLVEGSLASADACDRLVKDCDVVLNLGAVIPPRSDQNPKAAVECNEKGTDALVAAIERLETQPALIHTSTVALYGDRRKPHLYGRVGDPLLVSPLDIYSATKLRGEFRVLESNIKKWVVLRQTAMLYASMLGDNIHDGLMFHTRFNAPLEWLTAHDSGLLIKNMLTKMNDGTVPESFWKKCYNMAGGKINRSFGVDTFNDGFAIIGGCAKDFFKPQYNCTRNFHGMWYSDGDELNELFEYQTQSVSDYWREIGEAHPSFKCAKHVPKRIVGHFAVKRLLKDKNSPSYWANSGDEARITAHFGGMEKYKALEKADWSDVLPSEEDYAMREDGDNAEPVFYGFDFAKKDEDITIDDLKSVAEAHGGRLVSEAFETGDVYEKLEWETQDGERFTATPYTVLRAGHWFNPIYTSYVWDFDRLSKKDKVFASLWYDSHDRDEDIRYSFDENFKSVSEKLS